MIALVVECLKDIGERPLEKTEDSLKGVSKYKQILRMPAIHLMAFFMFACAGSQATLLAWMVTFLVKERRGGPNSGYVSSVMSGANTIGSLALILLSKKVCLLSASSNYVITEQHAFSLVHGAQFSSTPSLPLPSSLSYGSHHH